MKRVESTRKSKTGRTASAGPHAYSTGSDMAQLVGEDCVCLALRRATRRVSRLYDEALAPHGLTIGQLGVLAMITSRTTDDGGPSVQQLADAFEMDQSAMSRTLKPLVRDGLVSDRPHREDRRRRTLVLTEEGRDRMEIASEAWGVMQKRLMKTIDAVDAKDLMVVLDEFGRIES